MLKGSVKGLDVRRFSNVFDMLIALGWLEDKSGKEVLGMHKAGLKITTDDMMRGVGTTGGAYTPAEFLHKMIEKNWITEKAIEDFEHTPSKTSTMEEPEFDSENSILVPAPSLQIAPVGTTDFVDVPDTPIKYFNIEGIVKNWQDKQIEKLFAIPKESSIVFSPHYVNFIDEDQEVFEFKKFWNQSSEPGKVFTQEDLRKFDETIDKISFKKEYMYDPRLNDAPYMSQGLAKKYRTWRNELNEESHTPRVHHRVPPHEEADTIVERLFLEMDYNIDTFNYENNRLPDYILVDNLRYKLLTDYYQRKGVANVVLPIDDGVRYHGVKLVSLEANKDVMQLCTVWEYEKVT